MQKFKLKIFRIIGIIILIVFSGNIAKAQFEDFEEDTKKEIKPINEKIFFGGDFGLQFGTETFINISPQIGYYITDFWSAGTGLSYMFYRNKYYNYNTSIYGGCVFTELYPLGFLVLHGEFQPLNVKYYDNISREWDLSLLAGGGYRMTVGKKGFVSYLILWNFNQNERSFYTNPVFRISFYF